jgi:MYXO-CTERM domain-containing protein
MRRSILSVSMLLLLGCDLSASGSASASGSTAPLEGPAKPEYERTFDEFVDVPNQMTEQVKWAAEPIDNAILLADELAQLRTELNIDKETFSAMATVAFKDGTIEVGAVTEVEDAKAKIEATLNKIKQVGEDLKTVPNRVKVASKAIGKLAMSSPKLLLKSTKELSGELAVAVGDQGAQIEADIKTAKELPKTIKAEATEAKDKLTQLPDQAKQATQNLLAAIKGEPFEPMQTTGDGSAEGEAGADASAGGETAVAAGGDATADGGAAAGGGGGEAGAGGSDGGSGGGGAPTTAGGVVLPPAPGGDPANNPAANFPPSAVQARLAKLQKLAKATSDRGDWLSAADAYGEAYGLAPDNLTFAYKAGDAAAKAKDCERARIYLERFTQYADPTMFAPEIAIATKTLGELKTFECPPRTPGDEIALAETLVEEAEQLGKDDDWGGAATNYAVAYQLDPENHALAFEVAVASWNGRECGDASTYFTHFASVGDPRANRSQLREAAKYQEEFSAGMCPTWGVGEKETLARDLYAQGQALDLELDFKGAIGKYERAYYLLPTNHALAFRIGESAWKAQLCQKAGENYRTFVGNVDANDPRYKADFQAANARLSTIDSVGCPGALWGATGGGSASGGGGSAAAGGGGGGGGGEVAGGGGGAGDENPPETAKGGGGSSTSSVACSVTPNGNPAGGLAFGLLALAALLRRRRDQ